MKKNTDIWVKTRRNFSLVGEGKVENLELNLQSQFTGGFPVVFASARAAMTIVFRRFFEGELIRIFPYASQCVVTSIIKSGKVACTPTPGNPRDIDYNQWGVVRHKNTNLFMNDCADSLYPIGGIVCSNDSRFEVWSLPKIIGTPFGAVMWCRSEIEADALRKERDLHPKQIYFMEVFLSKLKKVNLRWYSFWEHYQFTHPVLNTSQTRSLSSQLDQWHAIYEERMGLFVSNYVLIHKGNQAQALKEILNNNGIIPTVIEGSFKADHSLSQRLHKVMPDGSCVITNLLAFQSGANVLK
jgi:putative PLP-dependent aminotransferase (TIGR04422 family)